MLHSKPLFFISLLTLCLTLVVVVLGAYVRLSDAGLGCPDWPGCYGKMIVPADAAAIEQASAAYPERPLHQGKAWKEMVHRYVAGTLGLLILFLTIQCWRHKRHVATSTFLLGFLVFQALLGMWTVTLLLKPVIVTSHLLGGMSILAILAWLTLRETKVSQAQPGFLPWAISGLLVVFAQITLGGWTSANYAALICPEFPTCRAGDWWPATDFAEGFRLWHGLGIDYEGGVLDAAARTAIHLSHRVGALVTLLVVAGVCLRAIYVGAGGLRTTAIIALFILFVQLSLGVANIYWVLPLPVAVAHNGVAALLLLSMVTLVHYSLPQKTS